MYRKRKISVLLLEYLFHVLLRGRMLNRFVRILLHDLGGVVCRPRGGLENDSIHNWITKDREQLSMVVRGGQVRVREIEEGAKHT